MPVSRSNENLMIPSTGKKSSSTGDMENLERSQQLLRKSSSELDPKDISRKTSKISIQNPNSSISGVERTTHPNTRQTSPNVLSPELQLRVIEQYDRIEHLENMFAELEINQDSIISSELDDLIEESKEIHKIFTNEHLKITTGWPASHINNEYFTSGRTKREPALYRKLMSGLRRLQEKLKPTQIDTSIRVETQPRSQVKLPDIRIPNFSGNYLEWPAFKAVFADLVLKRKDLDDTSKFQYLYSSITGPAHDTIRRIIPSETALETAWGFLLQRYENKRLAISQQLDRLYGLESIKVRTSENLFRALNILNETVEILSHLNHDANSNCLLVHHLTRLFDKETRGYWESNIVNSTSYPTVEFLKEFMTSQARTLAGMENADRSNQKSSGNRTPQQTVRKSHAFVANSRTFQGQMTKATSNTNSTTWVCDSCNGQHYIVKCPEFARMKPDERIHVIKIKGLCIYCLGRHSCRNCRSQHKNCKECGKAHHSMLHGGNLNILFGRNENQVTSNNVPRRKGFLTALEEAVADSPNSNTSQSEPHPTTSSAPY